MIIIQLTGLSGAGKTTIATNILTKLQQIGISCELLDADIYRQTICKDLGFSRNDRIENIKRLGEAAYSFTGKKMVAIIAAINPYEEARQLLSERYNAKLVWIDCCLEVLIKKDTKGLYKRALMENDSSEKIHNLSGVNDPFEIPANPDLIIKTHSESVMQSTQKLFDYIINLPELNFS